MRVRANSLWHEDIVMFLGGLQHIITTLPFDVASVDVTECCEDVTMTMAWLRFWRFLFHLWICSADWPWRGCAWMYYSYCGSSWGWIQLKRCIGVPWTIADLCVGYMYDVLVLFWVGFLFEWFVLVGSSYMYRGLFLRLWRLYHESQCIWIYSLWLFVLLLF